MIEKIIDIGDPSKKFSEALGKEVKFDKTFNEFNDIFYFKKFFGEEEEQYILELLNNDEYISFIFNEFIDRFSRMVNRKESGICVANISNEIKVEYTGEVETTVNRENKELKVRVIKLSMKVYKIT
jgi:hypothetical protein